MTLEAVSINQQNTSDCGEHIADFGKRQLEEPVAPMGDKTYLLLSSKIVINFPGFATNVARRFDIILF